MAMERHLWTSLTEMQYRDRANLLDFPISPSGLFGNAVYKKTAPRVQLLIHASPDVERCYLHFPKGGGGRASFAARDLWQKDMAKRS